MSYSEQASIHHVVHTFANYHNASAQGPDIAAGQVVQVSCKVLDGTITSVNPDGYWYRIASAPWNNGYYAPANTFLNGDPPNGPYSKNTDFAVPDCSSSVGGPPKPPAVPKPGGLTCPGYYVVGTRGSGDKLSQAEGLGAPGLAFKNALFNDLHEPNMQVVANPYPAAAVLWFATGGGGTKLWFDGVDTGESWLTAKIKALVVQCPSARLYLTGYSQGAEVVGDVYSVLGSALRAHVGGVVLFGDPRLNKSSFALSVTGLQRSRKTLTNNGALSMRGEFPSDARGRIISYCHGTDPVCQGLKQLVHDPLAQDHKNYNAEPGDAAAYFAAHR